MRKHIRNTKGWLSSRNSYSEVWNTNSKVFLHWLVWVEGFFSGDCYNYDNLNILNVCMNVEHLAKE